MATQPVYPLVTVEEFLAMDFGDRKAELDNGVIRMMAGGTRRHARVQSNIVGRLLIKLDRSGCTPYGSDMAIRTRPEAIRYPDVTVLCGKDDEAFDGELSTDDPRIVFEILSAGTARTDLSVKLAEYQAVPSIDTIVFVDIAIDRLQVWQRTGPNSWETTRHVDPYDLPLPSLGITLTHAEIFAR